LKQIRDQGAAPIATLGVSNSSGPEQEVRHDSFFGMTILDAIKKYLTMTKQTQSAPDIADALVRGGMKSAAKDFVGNVRTTLSKNEAFVSVKNGEWGLSVWYPAKRKEKQPKGTKPKKTKPRAKVSPKDGAEAKKLSETQQAILNYVNNASGPCKPQAVAEALKLNFNTTRVTMYKLAKRGLIRSAESGGFGKLSEAKQAKA